jgi:hypothetical protein
VSHLIIGAMHSTLAPIVPLSPRCNALVCLALFRLPNHLSLCATPATNQRLATHDLSRWNGLSPQCNST